MKAACVIGWPVEHSRSPLIHTYWIEHHRIDAVYRREAVRPEALEDFIAGLAERGYVGCNVTLPHKEAVMTLAEPDARARAIGAANTLWFENGRLRATNTDVEGFLASLDAAAPAWEKTASPALVIGAGGAARAVIFGLIERGVARIRLANRTLARAKALRERFGPAIEPVRWEELPAALAGAGLVVNASSLGMKGQPPLEIDLAAARGDAAIAEVVYLPLRTALLSAAARRGLRAADGLDMLLHQAVRGFELWFGVRPAVTAELRHILERELAKA